MSILLSLSLAFAQEDCDVTALSKAIETTTGDDAAVAFTQLASCDPERAKRYAKTTIITFFPGKEGYEAALAGMKLGQEKYVVEWMEKQLEPNEEKEMLRVLDQNCQANKEVQDFFLNIAKETPEDFWKHKYYQYLLSCRVKPVQDILTAQLEVGLEQGTFQYFGVMEAYAKNLEAAALPKLNDILTNSTDTEEQLNTIVAMTQAVTVTTENHVEDKKLVRQTTQAAIDNITKSAEKLSKQGLNQARVSLKTLGAEAESDQMAGFYYKEKKQEDGSYIWGLVVADNATCKKGKLKQAVHSSVVTEQGNTWADQLEERVKEVAEFTWEMNLGKECKGESEFIYVVPSEPFSNMDEYNIWVEKTKTEQLNPEIKKPIILDHEPLNL